MVALLCGVTQGQCMCTCVYILVVQGAHRGMPIAVYMLSVYACVCRHNMMLIESTLRRFAKHLCMVMCCAGVGAQSVLTAELALRVITALEIVLYVKALYLLVDTQQLLQHKMHALSLTDVRVVHVLL
jgi:hypothetical protein